ncbi:zinc metalloprotease HtpX [Halorubellus sp. JP-L1]|uniref:zinc metalloprotease HtpX n=1 Tax=Halorubellus sp. JP-L1 TaxID=2715753 RepID=UPI00140D2864|nr:zinc metalloprotease HtpX [Halorubellus sp. JP-L1]NHN43449.1 zinc metalloprotease HtpX [Halorubellus sp. JP-L1]
MQWKTDWGLQTRMGLTMFLLFAVYVAFAAGLTYALDASIWVVALALGAFTLAQYFFSDRLALYGMGAKEVSREEYPELYASVQRLSQQADLPMPTVAVADTSTPNAFATGRNRKNATVCVTTGLMRTLDRDELDGVVAHELAHIKNRDVLVITVASFLSSLAFLIVRWGAFFGGGRRGGRNGGGGVVVAILVSLVVWIVSFLLIRLLSRYREYAADRGGAAITGQPSALASALLKISGEMEKVPTQDAREQAEMNAFFIIPVKKGFVGSLFRTHPSTEKRVERLRDLERQLESR